MPWLKISVEAAGASAEALSERMLACGALSVSFGASGVIGDEVLEPPPGAVPLWPRVTVSGLFPPAVDAQAVKSALGAIGASDIDWLSDQDCAAPRSGDVPELRFGDRLAVVPRDAPFHPSHETTPIQDEGGTPSSRGVRPAGKAVRASETPSLHADGERPATTQSRAGRPRSGESRVFRQEFHVSETPTRTEGSCGVPPRNRSESVPRALLRLDPGLAFGTGQHPTTRSCLAWLADARLEGRSVLDYGCGSGILGIAAALLGAARVVAVDIEPQALSATRANAVFNDVALDAVTTPDGFLPQPGFDVVLANILANTLIELGPALSGCLNAGGRLVLAGLLEPQIDAVTAAYPSLAFDPPSIDGEWACLTGRRRD